MAANRLESNKPTAESDNGDRNAPPAEPAASGFKPWLPLLLNLLLMPTIAYAVTTFVLLPKINAGLSASKASAHAEKPDPKKVDDNGKDNGKGGESVPMPGKVLVNVAGTLGTRYLLVNFTLVGKNGGLKGAIEKNEAQLRDAASGALASKTIADLEKPGARNLIRSELISVFNNILGAGSVTEIYFTEFAIQ